MLSLKVCLRKAAYARLSTPTHAPSKTASATSQQFPFCTHLIMCKIRSGSTAPNAKWLKRTQHIANETKFSNGQLACSSLKKQKDLLTFGLTMADPSAWWFHVWIPWWLPLDPGGLPKAPLRCEPSACIRRTWRTIQCPESGGFIPRASSGRPSERHMKCFQKSQ